MMIKFKSLKKSTLLKKIITERIDMVVDRFPDLRKSKLEITLSMENSPKKAGPDLFTVKIFCKSGRYKNVILRKSAQTFYVALADVIEHLQERWNRFGDRTRVKLIKAERQALKMIRENFRQKEMAESF